ncbi:hypothetical protein [Micromonospora sp. NPDC050276]|uniref:hypothetical protein n=1 Tax=Micromonospora sp. NPDC050276 TaxID=3364278 RepID=UPI0037A0F5BE
MPLLFLPGVVAAAVGVLVLAGVAVADARRAHGAPPEAGRRATVLNHSCAHDARPARTASLGG